MGAVVGSFGFLPSPDPSEVLVVQPDLQLLQALHQHKK
jgi:hypothetical protein